MRLLRRSRFASVIRSPASLRARVSCSQYCRRCSVQTSACVLRRASVAAIRRLLPSWVRIRCRTPRRRTSSRSCGREPSGIPRRTRVTPGHVDYAAYRRTRGGYALAASCVNRERTAAGRHHTDGRLGSARPWRRRFPAGRKWKIVGGRTGPRLMAINIDEGRPGRSRIAITSSAIRTDFSKARSSPRGLWASMTFISTCATNTTAAAQSCNASSQPAGESALQDPGDSIFDVALAPTSAAKSRR